MPEPPAAARNLSRLLDMGFERALDPPVTTEALRVDRRTHKVTVIQPAMGTLVSVCAIGRSRDQAQAAIGEALAEMHRLIAVFSRFESASAITALNGAGRLDGPPPELRHVVTRALRYHAITRGAFDITVAPVVDAFRDRPGRLPSDAELREALALVGARHVAVTGSAIRFGKPGMAITLDGIAKGYIVDGMAAALERGGIADYLINAGGDIRAGGAREDRRPWTIAVRDPRGADTVSDTIPLTDAAVATSGGYEIYYDRERLHHHIVDGRVGRSPTRSTSVSVIAPTAIAADALATSAFVMEPSDGLALVESLTGCACLILDRDGRPRRSRSWPGRPLHHRNETER